MSRLPDDVDTEYGKHVKIRATGQITVRPATKNGYDNKVLQLTANELEFQSSSEANRFINRQKPNYGSPNALSGMRRLKVISQNDD